MWGRATKTNRAETGACRAIMWSRSGDVDVLLLNMRCATPPAASGWYCPCLRDQAFLTSSVVFRSYLILVSFIMLKNRGLLFPDQRAAVQEKIRNPKISKYILLSRYLLAFPGPFFFLACWIVVASLQMLSFMYAHLTFFHQGYDLFSELQPLMKLLGGQVNTR